MHRVDPGPTDSEGKQVPFADEAPPSHRRYFFALRDALPVPEEGWGTVLHPDCEHDSYEEAVGCQAATTCRLFAVEAASQEFPQAVALMFGALHPSAPGDEPFPDDASLPLLRTVAEVCAPVAEKDNGEHFDDCLDLLTRTSRALLNATQQLSPPVTRQRLWPLYIIVHEWEGRRSAPSVVLMEDGFLGVTRASRDQVTGAEKVLFAGLANNPVEAYQDFKLATRRAVSVEGDYVGASLKAAATCELLLKHTAWMLVWEASECVATQPALSEDELRSLRAAKPSQLIGRELSPRLGGNWDSKTPGSPIGGWRHRVSKLRNAVIHLGHRPSEEEAQESAAAIIRLESHVMDRLAASASKYPRTALLLAGRDGLEKRGKYHGDPKRRYEQESLHEYLLQYLAWLSKVSAPDEE